MSAADLRSYPLDQPLPANAIVAGSGRFLRYRRFPVFGWPWFLGRTLTALVLTVLWVAFNAVVIGILSGSMQPVLPMAAWQFLSIAVAVGFGPGLATLVRHRNWPDRIQAVALSAAIGVGILASLLLEGVTREKLLEIFAAWPGLESLSPVLDMPARTESTLKLINGLFGLAIYALLGGAWALRAWFSERRRYTEAAQTRRMRDLQAEKQQANLRLHALQARIEPHFLFNTLASIRALIRSDPAGAEAILDATTGYLRASIPQMRSDGALLSPLGQQLELCRSYLELMRLRLGDRLEYAVSAEPGMAALPCPPLLLITLVENAIKHGIEPKSGPGRIEVSARLTDELLELEVRDNGAGLQPGLGTGVGLANLREQLATQFGERASLRLGSAEGWTRAVIRMPRVEPEPSDD